jgi:hypothetical protein
MHGIGSPSDSAPPLSLSEPEEIATAQGKTVGGLEEAIVSDAKAHLDLAVADGKLTAAQEATMLTNLQSHVADMVNSTGGSPPGGPGAGHGAPTT